MAFNNLPKRWASPWHATLHFLICKLFCHSITHQQARGSLHGVGDGVHMPSFLYGLGTSTWVSASMRIMEVCDEKGGVDACLIHASITALALWWAASKLPRIVIVRSMGDFFSLGSRVLHIASNLLSFGTTQTCPLVPITYPPSAVMDGVSTNLGPVGRLDCGEGQTTAQICLRNGKRFSFRLQSRPHHDSHEVIAGK